MTAEPDTSLLTPPPDPEHIRSVLSKNMDEYPYPRPVDDSSEDDALYQDHQDHQDDAHAHALLDEDTTTTTTTTTTTMLSKGTNMGLNNLVARHQSVHQKYQPSPPSDGNGSEADETLDETTTTTQKSVTEPNNLRVRLQEADRSRMGSSLLNGSSSATSLASTRSSTSPGTPSSTDGYHAISTTSTVTTKKRKVRRPTFEARSSRLDPEQMAKNEDPFRGFHTLFWIVMGAYGLITFDQEWTRVGKAFGGTLFSSFSQDAIILAISDFGLVLSTGMAFLLIKVISKGWIRYRVAGMVIQHCVQVLFLLFAIAWTIWRDWPWVQSGFFTLHAITMLMKIHSYIAYNGELSEKLIQLKKSEAAYAQIKKDEPRTVDDDSDDSRSDSSSNHADHTYDHDTTDSPTGDNEQDANRLHHRLASEAAAALLQDTIPSDPTTINASQLAAEIEDLRSDLKCQNGELWPVNVTVANFWDYLLVPSLIYELQYPRTSRIRPLYVFEKSVATLGTFTLLYLTTEHYIYPVVFDPTISPLRALVLLLIPFMMNYLMIFYIIFECICNAFAELTCFADRNFYEDWWNCVSFDEWARKWNKPVHHFLLRHVYDSSIESFHLSKSNAAFATFFLSSCVHELVMMVVTRKVRLYLFVLQMFQLPLIWMGNNKTIRETPRLANALFWMGMFMGPPLLGVAYCYA
ncbi:MAG: MBOAT, membrane-bound O-acyltransferase family-domain-containing protein [Linnemannia gamsii]|nr:MAG: MBOAT, membrane-bound O-acyltransferase family-domain-containing protein [Linnemannia gamsii]